MPISSVGKRNSCDAGVTLIEMLVVVTIIAIMIAVSFPSLSSGVETLRLNAATRSIVSFINSGLNHAERRQKVVEVVISKADNTLWLHSSEQGYERRLQLPDGIRIESILPEFQDEDAEASRSFLLYPGGTVPSFGITVVNRKRAARVVRVDPMTGVPKVENLPSQ
jgi:prepilin-type N-terminal cleavage/methylation domain-containing protein